MSGNGNIWNETILIASRASFGGGRSWCLKAENIFVACLPTKPPRRARSFLGANCIFVVKFFLRRRISRPSKANPSKTISKSSPRRVTYPLTRSIHILLLHPIWVLCSSLQVLGILFLHPPSSHPYLRRFLRNCNQGPNRVCLVKRALPGLPRGYELARASGWMAFLWHRREAWFYNFVCLALHHLLDVFGFIILQQIGFFSASQTSVLHIHFWFLSYTALCISK